MSTSVDKVVQMTTALRKVKGNIERIFEKTPTDMIRGIRSSKGNEAKYISQCMEEIRMELKSEHVSVKANAIAKLNYLQMLGYDISWAAFNVIEVLSTPKFNYKRIGYLVASQIFNENTEVVMLTTNQVRKDMHSSNIYDAAVAMNGLACFVTADLARDLVNDVVILLNSSKAYIRKRAILLLYKLYLKYPEALPATFGRLSERLEDADVGVQSAAVYVVCELARRDPKSYLALAPTFFKLMTASSNNWMLIKIIKLFGCLTPLEPRLGKKLIVPLTSLINNTSAMSLLYECINTVLAVLISISSESPEDHMSSIQLCVQKLSVLIEDADQNLKYLGLLALGKILKTHPKAVQAMKDIILNCLDDRDESIRLRALDLLHGMVSKKNIMDIIKRLLHHVQNDSSASYRDNLVSKIIQICSFSNYKYITNFEWYVSVLVELTKAEGTKNGSMIAQQMLDVAVRVVPVRHFAVSQMAYLIDNANVLLAGSSQYRSDISSVLYAAAWICGEYSEHLSDPQETLEAMLRTKISSMPGVIQAVYVQNIGKIYCRLLDVYEKEADWDRVYSIDNLFLSKLPQFLNTDHIETQERVATLIEVVKEIEEVHKDGNLVGDDLRALYAGDLNPVAPKAQRKLPVPDDLNLNENIYTPPSSDESDVELSEMNFDTFGQYAEPGSVTRPILDEADTERTKMDRRKKEIENNPHYLKPSKAGFGQLAKKKAPDDGAVKSTEPVEIQLDWPLTIVSLEEFEKRVEVDRSKKSKKRSKKDRLKAKESMSEPEDGLRFEIYQGDGEMPENAKSTDDEEEQPVAPAAAYMAISGSVEEKEKKKSRRKKRSKEAEEKHAKSKKQSSEINDFDLWLAGGVSTKPKKEKHKKVLKVKKEPKANGGTDSLIAELAGLDFNSSVAVNSTSTDSTTGLSPLAEDKQIILLSRHDLKEEADSRYTLEVMVMFRNQTEERLTHVELSVVDSPTLKLTGSFGSFTLGPMEAATKKFSFLVAIVTDAERLRSVLTYTYQGRSEKLDFRLKFPYSVFIVPSSVSSVRFAELLEEQTLNELYSTQLKKAVALPSVIRLSCERMHLSLVESTEDGSALLFGRTLNKDPICVMLKNTEAGVSFECRCSNSSVAKAVAVEMKKLAKFT